MTTMRVVPMAPGEFGVEVEEGNEVTGHKVRLPPSFLDDLLLTDVDQELIVRETIDFLLEREPATSILPEFSLVDVTRYFPDFPEELQRRLS
ncbi:MAG: hypothetical protein QOD57_43 [Actinomycetota bacterium]|jgi:hypothetical protein|nr:hypothetical protein [Actinomycetota bacterium]MDQ1502316.1 hypothetical protein [Actinomycetota bacterium]MDQ1567177.1 hypothetical protein [Actinomycetota bacterium]